MRLQRRKLGAGVLRCGWVAVVTSLLVLTAIGRATWGEPDRRKADKAATTVISPGDRTVLTSDEVTLICRADDDRLSIDGTAGRWEPFSPPLRVSQLKLSPGPHKIQAGEQTLDVFIASGKNAPKPPEGWAVQNSHPMPDVPGHARCAVCHETRQDDSNRAVVGPLKSYKACFECHRPIDFEVDHAHILEPLESCEMCHALHGSKRASLLKASMRQLCAKCHDPDH